MQKIFQQNTEAEGAVCEEVRQKYSEFQGRIRKF